MSVLDRLLHRADADGELGVAPMRTRDLGAVLKIERVSYPKPWTEGVFRAEIDLARRGERCYLVARRKGSVVGYAGMMFAVGDAHITNIATAADHQRTGVGTRLLAELALEAIRRKCVAMTLEVRASNTAAQELYRRFGFAPVGVRKQYYENTEDAIVMWCHDISEPPYRARLEVLCPEACRR